MIKTNQKKYFFGAGILIAGFILGYILGSVLNYQRGLAQGRAEIETRYQEKIEDAFPSMLEPEEIFSVSGKIKEIKNKTLVLEETIYTSNPFEDPSTKQWQALTTEATELIKSVEKTPEELEEEMSGPLPSLKEITIDFSELEIGQSVSVISSENIKNKTEFEAQKIILQEF